MTRPRPSMLYGRTVRPRRILCVALALAAACGGAVGSGKSPKAGKPDADSGTSPTDGGPTITGATLPVSPPMTKRQACLAYLKAEDNRGNECKGQMPFDDWELPLHEQCPDLLFSDGSSRTLEGTLACATAWTSFPCSDLLRGLVPDCVLPGTRKPGASCVFGSQCDSSDCNANGTSCGTCRTLLAPGATCNDPASTCPNGQACTGGRCMDAPAPKSATKGGTCTATPDCEPGLSCLDQSDGSHACEALPSVGQACGKIASSHFCAGDALCNASLMCQSLPKPGDACGRPDDPSGSAFCASGAYCSTMGQCTSLPGPGQACATAENGVGELCSPDTLCAKGSCGPRLGPGETCHPVRGSEHFQGDCTAGLFCTCTDTACTTGSCLTILPEGAGCGARFTNCENGTACLAGSCVAPDSLGLLAQRCGGK